VDEVLRRYLQTRLSLGEPDLVFEGLGRGQARLLARRFDTGRLAPGAVPPKRGPGGAAGKEAAVAAAPRANPAAHGEGELSEEEVRRLGREGTAEEIGLVPDLESLRRIVQVCERCSLYRTRGHAVFGEGDPSARVVCVGEAPGAREDETGRPFVGPAGQLLDRLLLSVGFRREEVYICNVLKSRPPRNRDPLPEEIAACSPYLHRQLELIDPDVLVAFGAFAARTLLSTTGSLGSLRGRTHRYRGYPLVVTYHPAALLRNRSWTRPTWEDLQRVRRIVDGQEPEPASDRASGIESDQQLGLV
jgi:uracil-DNA glycosylase family 4